MFTGIIETTANILSNANGSLVTERPSLFADTVIGASIAVSGACLTVTAFDAKTLSFDVIPETLSRTSLGNKVAGESVNMERALSAQGRFDGHMVQGHVEGVGVVSEKLSAISGQVLIFKMPKELITNIVQKGSITLDGVSLTVADLQDDLVSVALIPHTLSHTTLGELQVGSIVNVETDILGRYVAAFLKRSGTIPA